jgi:uncharacterized protein with GYD domain
MSQQQYVILWNWTDQGIRNVKGVPKGYEAFKAELQKAGGSDWLLLNSRTM